MIFNLRVPEGEDWVLELDAEGIEYLEAGLAELRGCESGDWFSSPALSEDGVGRFVLLRAGDADSS